MSGGFRVLGSDLAGHAAQVEELAERMRRAADAGRPLDRDAYGIVGQVFAEPAADSTRSASESIGVLADVTAAFAAGLRATSADYRDAEHGNATRFGAPR
ncbi:type VII secretion target [Pseudonocardia nigra]|uniref:type VII secretion target n=1 Tax=Pseudonocardia nigra TaxID=1921578 RepID=UPI001C5CCACF|nr:type VII secretion target [Pseudonocardia nigra]